MATDSAVKRARASLEQLRAADAWECCEACTDAYVSLAKGLPALIMTSGLMQVFAFLHQKGGEHEVLALQLRRWLRGRFAGLLSSESFHKFMTELMQLPAREYQAVNAEAFAWLRWLRQMAAARKQGA